MSILGIVLLIILVMLVLGMLPAWGHSRSWGYGPSGGLGVVLVIVLILLFMGHLLPAPIYPDKGQDICVNLGVRSPYPDRLLSSCRERKDHVEPYRIWRDRLARRD